jgi:hypothetical protein
MGRAPRGACFVLSSAILASSINVIAGDRLVHRFKAFRLRRVHFFDKRQRNEPKKTLSSTQQTRVVIGVGIFRQGIHALVEKRRTSMCAALRVSG